MDVWQGSKYASCSNLILVQGYESSFVFVDFNVASLTTTGVNKKCLKTSYRCLVIKLKIYLDHWLFSQFPDSAQNKGKQLYVLAIIKK